MPMGKHSKRVSLSMLLVDSVDSSACSDGTVSILHMSEVFSEVSRFISKFITKQNEN